MALGKWCLGVQAPSLLRPACYILVLLLVATSVEGVDGVIRGLKKHGSHHSHEATSNSTADDASSDSSFDIDFHKHRPDPEDIVVPAQGMDPAVLTYASLAMASCVLIAWVIVHLLWVKMSTQVVKMKTSAPSLPQGKTSPEKTLRRGSKSRSPSKHVEMKEINKDTFRFFESQSYKRLPMGSFQKTYGSGLEIACIIFFAVGLMGLVLALWTLLQPGPEVVFVAKVWLGVFATLVFFVTVLLAAGGVNLSARIHNTLTNVESKVLIPMCLCAIIILASIRQTNIAVSFLAVVMLWPYYLTVVRIAQNLIPLVIRAYTNLMGWDYMRGRPSNGFQRLGAIIALPLIAIAPVLALVRAFAVGMVSFPSIHKEVAVSLDQDYGVPPAVTAVGAVGILLASLLSPFGLMDNAIEQHAIDATLHMDWEELLWKSQKASEVLEMKPLDKKTMYGVMLTAMLGFACGPMLMVSASLSTADFDGNTIDFDFIIVATTVIEFVVAIATVLAACRDESAVLDHLDLSRSGLNYERDTLLWSLEATCAIFEGRKEYLSLMLKEEIEEYDQFRGHFFHGLAAMIEDRRADAVKSLRTCTELNPNYADAYFLMAYIRHSSRDYEHARELCQIALHIQPRCAQFLTFYGRVFEDEGKGKEAMQQFAKAVRCDKSHAKAYTRMMLNCSRDGDHSKASVWGEKAVTYDKGNYAMRVLLADECEECDDFVRQEQHLVVAETLIERGINYGDVLHHFVSFDRYAEAMHAGFDMENFGIEFYCLEYLDFAKSLLLCGKPADAVHTLERGCDDTNLSTSSRMSLRFHLSQLLTRHIPGGSITAINHLDIVINHDPLWEACGALYLLGISLAESGQGARSLTCLEETLDKLDRENLEKDFPFSLSSLYFNLAMSKSKQKQSKGQVASYFLKAYVTSPKSEYIVTWMRLAVANREFSERWINGVMEDIVREKDRSGQETDYQLLYEAVADGYHATGLHKQGIRHFEDTAKISGAVRAASLRALARLYSTINNPKRTRQYYGQLMKEPDVEASDYVAFFDFEIKEGEEQRAMRVLEDGIANFPKDPTLLTRANRLTGSSKRKSNKNQVVTPELEAQWAIENRERLERRSRKVKIDLICPFRPGKKLLVLDIDFTIIDLKGTAQDMRVYERPYMTEFLAAMYEYYDICFWSQTHWRWLELKLTALGILSNPSYRINFVVDRSAMIKIKAKSSTGKERIHEVKALELIWKQFPRFNKTNTIHVDDLGQNFAMNPENGIKCTAYKDSKSQSGTDIELLLLAQYLSKLAKVADMSKVNHDDWRRQIDL